jgi:hypothetical protein
MTGVQQRARFWRWQDQAIKHLWNLPRILAAKSVTPEFFRESSAQSGMLPMACCDPKP